MKEKVKMFILPVVALLFVVMDCFYFIFVEDVTGGLLYSVRYIYLPILFSLMALVINHNRRSGNYYQIARNVFNMLVNGVIVVIGINVVFYLLFHGASAVAVIGLNFPDTFAYFIPKMIVAILILASIVVMVVCFLAIMAIFVLLAISLILLGEFIQKNIFIYKSKLLFWEVIK